MWQSHCSVLRRAIVNLLAGLLFCGACHAQTLISSGAQKLSLVELYTSQGCSSCPPADRWLSALQQDSELWTEVVPVAFHVDYWDYIGWKDPYAQPDFGKRQQRYAAEGGLKTVYTPGLLLNGKDWQGWRRDSLPKRPEAKVGDLQLEISADRWLARFTPVQPAEQRLLITVAWLGSGLESNIAAGENRGRRLTNDFIVLDLAQSDLRLENGVYTATGTRPHILAAAPRTALAAWVATESSLMPIQAAGGWLE